MARMNQPILRSLIVALFLLLLEPWLPPGVSKPRKSWATG